MSEVTFASVGQAEKDFAAARTNLEEVGEARPKPWPKPWPGGGGLT